MTVNAATGSFSQGDTVNRQFPIYSTGTTPATLTAPTFVWAVADSAFASVARLVKTGSLTFSGGVWTAAVLLSETETASLPAGKLFEQISVKDTDGSNETVYRGVLTVLPTISDAAIASSSALTPDALAALLTAGGASSPLALALAALVPELPTAPTSGASTLWSDGGVPVVSQG